jgi:hypothetical protein
LRVSREYAVVVIVVVGQPSYRETEAGPVAGGLASRIAKAAATHGRSVQIVGKVGEDEAGDAVVLALARTGVGHVAILRDAGRPTARIDVARDALEGGDPSPGSALIDDPPAQPGDAVGGLALEAADVDLALRYLTEFRVLVLADRLPDDAIRIAAAAASWADARLILIVPSGEVEPVGLPPDAIVFEATEADPDGVFAGMVGAFAAALDDGDEPATAFRSVVTSGGWSAAPDDADA